MKKLIFIFLLIQAASASEKLYSSSPIVNHRHDVKLPVMAVGSELSGSAKLMTDWMDIYVSAIKTAKMPSHHFREITYTSIAFYESLVNGDPSYRSLAGQADGLASLPEPKNTENFSWQASGNAAMAEMLKFFYPANPAMVAKFDSMAEATVSNLKSEGYDGDALEAGREYGKSVALAIIDYCKTDLSDKENAMYKAPQGDGMWEPTPPSFRTAMRPWGGNNRTIVKESIKNTLPPQPFAFSTNPSSDFYKMVNEVYEESGSTGNDHKEIALHWDDAPDGSSLGAGGHWLCILKDEIAARNIPLIESARVWAEMYIAMYDASIGCFKAKYTYNMIRPVTYIRKYMNKHEWEPLIVTPSHPEYPAAHATISMAAATVLANLLGNTTRFVDHSYEYRGYKPRTFNSFTDAGREAGLSRLYGGIHYRPSIEAGYVLGEKIANNVLKALVFRR